MSIERTKRIIIEVELSDADGGGISIASDGTLTLSGNGKFQSVTVDGNVTSIDSALLSVNSTIALSEFEDVPISNITDVQTIQFDIDAAAPTSPDEGTIWWEDGVLNMQTPPGHIYGLHARGIGGN